MADVIQNEASDAGLNLRLRFSWRWSAIS